MKKRSFRLNAFRFRALEAGFTLTEILVSALLVSSAVAISGMGVSSMVTSNQYLEESNERQDELNRALDFISTEIRQAKSINQASIPTEFNDTLDASLVKTASVNPILWLDMGLGQKVVYYVAQPEDENGPWRSPQILVRWGAAYNTNGHLEENPQHTVLMDSLHSQINSGEPPNCPKKDNPDPSLRWSVPITDPEIAKNLGFYACVAPNNRTAILTQVGHIRRVLEATDSIRYNRQVFSRSSRPPSITNQPNSGGFKPTGIQPSSESNVTISHRGGEITCGANGASVPIETSVILNFPSGETQSEIIRPNTTTNHRVPAGTELTFTANRLMSNCAGEFTVASEQDVGTQVVFLADNDSIPFYEPFASQTSINSFLEQNLDSNGRLSIAKNQRVLLFELGEIYSANPSEAFDFQDVVLLAEVKPIDSRP